MENSTSQIKTEVKKSNITVDEVYESQLQKEGTLTARLRQVVTTTSFYPSKKVASEMSDNIFDPITDFNFEAEPYENIENRIAFMLVPQGTTKEQVEAGLKNYSDACIYKVLRNHPILSSDQEYGITSGLTTKDIIADSQVVRYSKDHPEFPGKVVTDRNGKVQYRCTFFKKNAFEDIDDRTSEIDDMYVTDTISAELEDVTVIREETIM